MTYRYRMRPQRRSETEIKTHPKTRRTLQRTDGEANEIEPVCDVHLSVHSHAASSAQWTLGTWVTCMTNKDQEVDLCNERLGFWLQEQQGPPAFNHAFLRQSSYPGVLKPPSLHLV